MCDMRHRRSSPCSGTSIRRYWLGRCGSSGASEYTRRVRAISYKNWHSEARISSDARRFWDDMRKRFEEFSLSLNPDKTRLIEFGRFAAEQRAHRGLGKPETFNFLGFTFICERNSRGQYLVKRTTRRDRMRATLRRVKEELRRRMHEPIPEQGAWLKQVVRGFFAYHAVPTNG